MLEVSISSLEACLDEDRNAAGPSAPETAAVVDPTLGVVP
jgi:hypothetical protein